MDRAQSEVVGTILLVAVVVITVSIWGAFQLAKEGDIEDDVILDVAPKTTENGSLPSSYTDLELGHNGGDAITLTDLKLIVRSDGLSCEEPFEGGSVTGPDSTWNGGEIWSPPSGGTCSAWNSGGVVRLLVVYEPSSSSVYNQRWDVEA